jgi:hypothetical protein
MTDFDVGSVGLSPDYFKLTHYPKKELWPLAAELWHAVPMANKNHPKREVKKPKKKAPSGKA